MTIKNLNENEIKTIRETCEILKELLNEKSLDPNDTMRAINTNNFLVELLNSN